MNMYAYRVYSNGVIFENYQTRKTPSQAHTAMRHMMIYVRARASLMITARVRAHTHTAHTVSHTKIIMCANHTCTHNSLRNDAAQLKTVCPGWRKF